MCLAKPEMKKLYWQAVDTWLELVRLVVGLRIYLFVFEQLRLFVCLRVYWFICMRFPLSFPVLLLLPSLVPAIRCFFVYCN